MSDCPVASVIVPAFREAENLPRLVPRISAALQAARISHEVIVVDDDSRDGTKLVCERLSRTYPLRLITRTDERGLSTAVIRGLDEARGEALVVMDADLSHPPEALPQLVAACLRPDVDFAIGSRYVAGGSVDPRWSNYRRLNSRVAGALARGLTAARDPMAGYFALRRPTFQQAAALDPLGYKIGLELIVRCGCRQIAEIPIHFEDRRYGQSKLTARQQWLYLRHLGRLYAARFPAAPAAVRFAAVGASGAAIDLGSLSLLLAAVPFAVARAAAIALAMTWNYFLHRRLTFCETGPAARPWRQFAAFCGACLTGAGINWGVSLAASPLWGGGPGGSLAAAAAGVVAGAAANFLACSRWVFRGALRPASAPPPSIAPPVPAEPQVPTGDPRRRAA